MTCEMWRMHGLQTLLASRALVLFSECAPHFEAVHKSAVFRTTFGSTLRGNNTVSYPSISHIKSSYLFLQVFYLFCGSLVNMPNLTNKVLCWTCQINIKAWKPHFHALALQSYNNGDATERKEKNLKLRKMETLRMKKQIGRRRYRSKKNRK